MPMRGKLRYSFRCTLILSWVFVFWNKYSILPQRDCRTSVVLVQFCRRNCPAGPAPSFGPVWTLRKGRCSGLVSNTVDKNLGISPLKMFRRSVGFFKFKIFRLQFWDGAFLIQDFSPAVSGWRFLSSRCFTCSFGMPP